MQNKKWIVYLSGEIHSDWREQIKLGAEALNLPVNFVGPVTNHDASDSCGVRILGAETDTFWHDNKGAKLNSIRSRKYINSSDIVVIRFGEKYRQWNAAFDAGYAAALGKSIITLHDSSLNHALKEVDSAAHAVTSNPEQVVKILTYSIEGIL